MRLCYANSVGWVRNLSAGDGGNPGLACACRGSACSQRPQHNWPNLESVLFALGGGHTS